MAYKKNKSKRSAIDHPDIAAQETAKVGSSIGPQPLMSMKHGLSDDADKATASNRLMKRRKVNSNAGLHHHDPSSTNIPVTTLAEDIQAPDATPGTFSQALPPEVRHLSTKYNFAMMSILSSAKISDKVEKLLQRVGDFSFADPKSKPGVVVLHAKSGSASKMVSIVEIARQEIERQKGKWWQYTKLHGQIAELKAKPLKRSGGGITLSEWQEKQAGGEFQGVEEAGGEAGRASERVEQDHELVEGNEEMEDAFETMVDPKEATDEGVEHSAIRAIPVMTIYFARVRVFGLKELYGYVFISSVGAGY